MSTFNKFELDPSIRPIPLILVFLPESLSLHIMIYAKHTTFIQSTQDIVSMHSLFFYTLTIAHNSLHALINKWIHICTND